MISLIVPLMLLGVMAGIVMVVSGLAYVLGQTTENREPRASGTAFKWSAIVLGVCAVLVVVLAVIFFQ